MKKTLIFAGMLSIGYAYAQQGNVGVNTDAPKATLDVQPSATNLSGTTNEGILAPRLSKTRVASIADPKEGTLVYVTNDTASPITAYAGNDGKVADINDKGYYFYNGAKWVKASAGNVAAANLYTTNGQLSDHRTVDMNNKTLSFLKGSIGIGTSTPYNAIDILGDGGANDDIQIHSINNTPGSSATVMLSRYRGTNENKMPVEAGDSLGNLYFGAYNMNNTITYPVYIDTKVTEVNSNGAVYADLLITSRNVGIGTTSPRAKFEVNGGGIRVSKGDPSGDGANVGYAFDGDGDTGLFAVGGETNYGSDLVIKNDGLNVINIKTGTRNVGIGTDSPTAKLDVAGNIKVQTPGTIWLSGKTGTGGITSSTKLNHGSYHPFLRQETADGHFVNLGGLGNLWGIYGYDKDRTENGFDHSMVMDLATGNVSIGHGGGYKPTSKLDVQGEIVAQGLNGSGVLAYLGGDQFSNDVELGSLNASIKTVQLYNRAAGEAMSLGTNHIYANGNITVNGFAGTGTRNVVADSTGKLVIGQAATPIRTVTASTTIAATDDKGYVYVEATGATTITVPNTLPAGFSCVIIQQGDGQVTIAGSGVTLQTARGTKTRAKFSAVGVIKRTADTATITGDAVN